MAAFDFAINKVLTWEGGYSNDPLDPGGETKFGISKRSYPRVDIKNLTRDQAIAIYRRDFWDRYNYGKILNNDTAAHVLDLTVNHGPDRAGRIVQTSLNSLGENLTVDGAIGPKTIAAINRADPKELNREIANKRINFYKNLASTNPKFQRFIRGWLNRAESYASAAGTALAGLLPLAIIAYFLIKKS